MKQNIRKVISTASSYLEICLSVIVLLVIAITAVGLVMDIIRMFSDIFENTIASQYEVFIGDALKLIIGVEFVKMLAKHTPESIIEVLLFAIARKLIVGNSTITEIVIGVAAIGALFAVRKYLYTSSWSEIPKP